MSKTLKRALMGGALGALQGVQSFYQTQRAQEAERLKEERLAAIRAQERGEDRAFQRETFDLQAERELSREDRLTDRQMRAEERAEERAARDRAAQFENQRQLMREQVANRPPENTGYVEFIDSNGVPGTMTRAEFASLPPAQRQGLRFRGEYSQQGSTIPGAAVNQQSGSVGGTPPAPRTPDFIYDPKNGLSPKT